MQQSRTGESEIGQKEGLRYRFRFQMDLCIGCPSCVTACNEENSLPPRIKRRRVGELEDPNLDPEEEIRYFLSTSCNHCLDPACLKGCPARAYTIQDNGIVLHDETLCMGCGYCTWSCPYGVPIFREETGTVTKCDLCQNRLSRGENPACVEACPTGALTLEKKRDDAILENLLTDGVSVGLPPPGLTKPSTKFNPPRRTKLEQLRRAFQPALVAGEAPLSLIFQGLFSRMGAGLALLSTALAANFTAKFSSEVSGGSSLHRIPLLVTAGFLFAALLAGSLHPARKERLWRALRGFPGSAITQESVLLAILASIATTAALSSSRALEMALFVGATGIVAAMAYVFGKIYRLYSRPLWNGAETALEWLFGAFTLAIPLQILTQYLLFYMGISPGIGLLPYSGGFYLVATTLRLLLLLKRRKRYAAEAPREFAGSGQLMWRMFPYRSIAAATITVLAVGFGVAAMFLLDFSDPARDPGILLYSFAVLAPWAILEAAAGFMQIDLFFALSVPFTIPGFATVNVTKRLRGSKERR